VEKMIAIQATVTRTNVQGWSSSVQIPTFYVDMGDVYAVQLQRGYSEATAEQIATDAAAMRAVGILDPHNDADCVSVDALSPEPHRCYSSYTTDKRS